MANRVEVAVNIPTTKVVIPTVRIPGPMPDITQSPEYQQRLGKFREIAAQSHRLAAEADTMLERMKIICGEITAQVADEMAEEKSYN